jgi:alpha-L-fucosidase 2
MRYICFILIFAWILSCSDKGEPGDINFSSYDLISDTLSSVWDEGIPLGNGVIGALIWQKGDHLRMSLDRSDLWDLRPMENLKTPDYKFAWVYQQWKADNYKAVQERFDVPYDQLSAPSKIPGAGMEFDISSFGRVASARLSIKEAFCTIEWEEGVNFTSFVHATEPVGWFSFTGVDKDFQPVIIPPAYNKDGEETVQSPVTGQDLRRLGYPEGQVIKDKNSIKYTQKGWGGFTYEVYVSWTFEKGELKGCWSISSAFPEFDTVPSAAANVEQERKTGFSKSLITHRAWWSVYWDKSSITIPDSVLAKQWYLEQYKFGSAARDGSPPISLQAVWTADNGKLPPWKGDFHHDLNTQLSYWPAYSGNHLDLEIGFLNWLDKYKASFKQYTREYYQAEGLNVPGVTTLTGEPMGGWIQYSFGPTVGAWLGHHYYLHWRYSMDRNFLKDQAYPWLEEVAIFFGDLSVFRSDGKRKLPISSSPEIYNNSREAWFEETTNFDLAMIRWTYEKASELALELGDKEAAEKWKRSLSEWPELTIDGESGLVFAPGTPYTESHRHFSHLVGFHPLGIIDRSRGDKDTEIIQKTLNRLQEVGSDYYTGYSFSWLGNLHARNLDGENAARALRIFADNFCLANSFHANGEQHNRGFSRYKYRPFTLEGNFAFASGIQEMLLQSHSGVVHVFPAIPETWKTLSFDKLRAEGAFLVSASMEDGQVVELRVTAEKGGVLRLKNPYGNEVPEVDLDYVLKEGILEMELKPGQDIIFMR